MQQHAAGSRADKQRRSGGGAHALILQCALSAGVLLLVGLTLYAHVHYHQRAVHAGPLHPAMVVQEQLHQTWSRQPSASSRRMLPATAGRVDAGVRLADRGSDNSSSSPAPPPPTALAAADAYMARLRAAVATPVCVVVMTGLFWQLAKHTHSCNVDGVPLECHVTPDASQADTADALYYHMPSFSGRPRPKAFPNQLRVAMSLESSAYYPQLDNPAAMCHFDAEMTYRRCAQVTNWYSLESLPELFKEPPLPFEEKLHAVAYINSNCAALSGRSQIMKQLIALGERAKVPVHALGGCDRNTAWPAGNPTKRQVLRRYKFCVAMENSIRHDYMTEKLWDALAAGCIPIYLGSRTAQTAVPDPDSFIMYDSGGGGDASTPVELDALMHSIGSNRTRYEQQLAWKRTQPEQQPSPLFRHLWTLRQTSGECLLCQFLARHRVSPQTSYTTCLFNEAWMAAAGQRFVPAHEHCPARPDQS